MRSYPTVALYLNTQYTTKQGLHPVKLRVTYRRRSKYFKTKFYLTPEQFQKAYKTALPRGQFRTLKKDLLKVMSKAEKTLDELETFTFQEFERLFFSTSSREVPDLHELFEMKIGELDRTGKHGSSTAYAYARRSLQEYHSDKLEINDITPKFLGRYQAWMLEQGKTPTTVGIYLRCLRSIFNNAIALGICSNEAYPFGKARGLYQIPDGNNTKKALTWEQINLIRDFEAIRGSRMELARDFWLLSFYLGGMNAADLLRLKLRDFDGESVAFVREKTKSTSKQTKKTILYLVPQALTIIERHKAEKTDANVFLFPFLSARMSSLEMKKRVNDFNNIVRKEMLKLSDILGFGSSISMMHARHSFANIAWNKQVPVSYIADCMSHTSVQTTTNYLKSISSENKAKTMETIFN